MPKPGNSGLEHDRYLSHENFIKKTHKNGATLPKLYRNRIEFVIQMSLYILMAIAHFAIVNPYPQRATKPTDCCSPFALIEPSIHQDKQKAIA
ncbi:MAG: hypothetical protein AB1861_26835, partial [Cyanobacteriota bacterium]